MILLTPSPGLGGFAKKLDVQTAKPLLFKCTLMLSELPESEVGFDSKDKSHPSHTYGIKTEGRHCFSWEKDQHREMTKPKILLNISFTQNERIKTELQ